MPNMTRSHYNLIADAVAEFEDFLTPDLHSIAAAKMTAALAGTNSQFKADRFRERCLGVKAGR